MRFKAFIHNLTKKNRRQKLTLLSAVFIVYVMLLAGIFSYFHSEDNVSNRLEAKNGSIALHEPSWDNNGQYKAKASEPGMHIEKDPYGYNNGQIDLFIRLKMTIDTSSFTSRNETYDSIYHYAEANRINAILASIRLKDGSVFLSGDSTNNTNFIMDTTTENGKPVYYFYYTGGDTYAGNDMMKIVKPGQKTDELFDHIDIPIYKKDYLGVFDQPYDIVLEAQGIPAMNYPNGLTVNEAKGSNSPFNE